MGDISRHRDIFLNTRESVPGDLLSRCRLSREDLTYLELGNYFTDVSQFRDPVFYLYAKQTVWRDEVLPAAAANGGLTAAKAAVHLLLLGAAAAIAGKSEGKTKALAIPVALGSPVLNALDSAINNLMADYIGVDEWLDAMLGKPIEKLDKHGKRKPEDYGYVGRFFQHFIEGITHMLFADDVPDGPKGEWSKATRIPSAAVATVFAEVFTQYFPHEHTDQPPYVWDASQRPGNPMYEPAPRGLGRQHGIMGIVHDYYLPYLAERLSTLENEWRGIGPNDQEKRRMWLLAMGKVLHGIEDWFFHSNIVELTRIHAHNPDAVPQAEREGFTKRTVLTELKSEPEYTKSDANRPRLERLFYRRIRFPVYGRGTRQNSGGVASTSESTLNWDHVYPAFPSTLDSAHTLIGALEGLEAKLDPGSRSLGGLDMSKLFSGAEWLSGAEWVDCLLHKFHGAGPEWSRVYRERAVARNVTLDGNGMPRASSLNDIPRIQAWAIDVLRELVPLVLTLLHRRERQRLNADVAPNGMPLDGTAPRLPPGVKPGVREVRQQLERHADALKLKKDVQGFTEHNYARAARYLNDCGSLNSAGRDAIVKAFEIDIESETKKVNVDTPGAGGFLIKFALKLQATIDQAEAASTKNDRADPFASVATDNGSANEIVGSHSLMSKDTKQSHPFFDDARVLAAVASLSTFQIMLEEVSAPGEDRLNWLAILRYFVRFPVASGGWERQVMARFVADGRTAIPTFADIPELGNLKKARMPVAAARQWWTGERTDKLRQMYVDLEKKVSQYRYP